MNVTLYTRRNCPLCDAARAVIDRPDVTVHEVDVDADPALQALFTNDVPVIDVGGRLFFHRIDRQQFEEALRGARERDPLPIPHGWQIVDGQRLTKELAVADFAAALALANRIGAIAEAQNHHPDLLVQWGRLGITTTTHDAGGLTHADFRLAAAIDGLSR